MKLFRIKKNAGIVPSKYIGYLVCTNCYCGFVAESIVKNNNVIFCPKCGCKLDGFLERKEK